MRWSRDGIGIIFCEVVEDNDGVSVAGDSFDAMVVSVMESCSWRWRFRVSRVDATNLEVCRLGSHDR